MNKVTNVAISICLYRREQNWPKILRAIEGACIGCEDMVQLCVWNNDKNTKFAVPDDFPIPTHINNSTTNLICAPRYFMPLMLQTDMPSVTKPSHFQFLDDDAVPAKKFVKAMIDHWEQIGDENALIGNRGVKMENNKRFGRTPRYESRHGMEMTEPVQVDYLAGQSIFGPIHVLRSIISDPIPEWCQLCEDIWFMYTSQKNYGSKKYAVPTPPMHRLSTGGYSITQEWGGNREESLAKCINMGFKLINGSKIICG